MRLVGVLDTALRDVLALGSDKPDGEGVLGANAVESPSALSRELWVTVPL